MGKHAAVLIAAAFAAGCAANHRPDPAEEVSVRWVRVADPDATCREISKQRGARVVFFAIKGCSTWDADARTCVIYARDVDGRDAARDRDRLATLGHELKHCFDGNWHDAYGNLRKED